MILNKKERLRYLGFDDRYFVLVGIFLLSFVTYFLFNYYRSNYSWEEALLNWGICLFFTICNWTFMRFIMIRLRKKYPSFQDTTRRIFYIVLIIISSVAMIDYVGYLLFEFDDGYNPSSRLRVWVPVVIISIMVQAIYEAIYYYTQINTFMIEKEQAKQVVVKAQLDSLRNQAQPHFFFNSLNTLRDIIENDPKKTAVEFVDNLSDVFRFILESRNHHLISLEEEIAFAKAYIHIQKERFGNNLRIEWGVSDEANALYIVPMSLQILIENAIKHNVVSTAKPLTIHVDVDDDQIFVKNKLQPKTSSLPTTKMGLKNIIERYRLISDKIPTILNIEGNFCVSIPLLSSISSTLAYESPNH